MSDLNTVNFDDFFEIEEKYLEHEKRCKTRKTKCPDVEQNSQRKLDRQQTKNMKTRRLA